MTIETNLKPEEIPQQVRDFNTWMQDYVHSHNLIDGCSLEEYERDHRAAFEAAAQSFGLTMHPDGMLTLNKPS